MLDADLIKVIIIDYILNNTNPDLLVSELSFLQGYRKADLVSFKDSELTAFEIKSSRDSLAKLKDQMIDYTSVFPYCYLVTTENHLKPARKIISPKVGIILISNNQLVILRTAKENRRLSKRSIFHSIPSKDFQKFSKNYNVQFTKKVSEKTIIKKTTTQTLMSIFYNSMFLKYTNRYNLFLSDRGKKTSLTDLYYLQGL